MQNNHVFHRSKLHSLIKVFQWAQRGAQLKHIIPTKTRAAERPRCIMQGLLLPRRMTNPCPQRSDNLRRLPRAAGLERSSHGVTQSKMLTNFLTFRHENKGRLVLVHYPSKLSKLIYNKLNEKNINNYKT